MLNVFFKKTIFGGSPLAARNLLLDLPLDLFRGYWHTIATPRSSRMTFEHAVDVLKASIEDLFGSLPQRAHQAGAYFPADLRNPILQAGSERRLLRLTYDGVTRLVEPYQLAFKRRKDGIAQEYLYVWDRTGGRSGPGIKALLNGKVQSIEVTDEIFEPQFTMRITKAGDASSSGTFAAQARPRTRRSYGPHARSRPDDGPRYVVQCSYCGKEFKRKQRTTADE